MPNGDRSRLSSAHVTVAVVMSIVGAVIHNVAEFGWSTMANPDTYISNGGLVLVLALPVISLLMLRKGRLES